MEELQSTRVEGLRKVRRESGRGVTGVGRRGELEASHGAREDAREKQYIGGHYNLF